VCNGRNNFIIRVELENSSDVLPSVTNMTEETMRPNSRLCALKGHC